MKKFASKLGRFALTLAGFTVLIACEEDIGRPSELNSLRIVAVRSSTSFASPGASVQLEMLLHDGSLKTESDPGVSRSVRVLWMTGCVNPSGDLYYNCFPKLHESLKDIADSDLQGATSPRTEAANLGFGTIHQFALPTDLISSRPQAEEVLHPYGVVMVFYAACAGELRVERAGDQTRDYPVGCYKQGTKEPVDLGDFEFGFYPIYGYQELSNENPIVDSLNFQKAASGNACVLQSDCANSEACGTEKRCIPRLKSCGHGKACKGYRLKPVVDPKSVESAISARLTHDRAPLETLWVSYYADYGRFEKDSRIVHDAASGYTDDYAGLWFAEADNIKRKLPREVELYTVIRDSRGGVTWRVTDVYVE